MMRLKAIRRYVSKKMQLVVKRSETELLLDIPSLKQDDIVDERRTRLG